MRWIMWRPLCGSSERVTTPHGDFAPGEARLVYDEVALELLPHEVVDKRGRKRQVGALGFVEVDPPEQPAREPQVITVQKRAGSIASALTRKGKTNGK
jgi:hypothetical protein